MMQRLISAAPKIATGIQQIGSSVGNAAQSKLQEVGQTQQGNDSHKTIDTLAGAAQQVAGLVGGKANPIVSGLIGLGSNIAKGITAKTPVGSIDDDLHPEDISGWDKAKNFGQGIANFFGIKTHTISTNDYELKPEVQAKLQKEHGDQWKEKVNRKDLNNFRFSWDRANKADKGAGKKQAGSFDLGKGLSSVMGVAKAFI